MALIRISVSGLEQFGRTPQELRREIRAGIREGARFIRKDLLNRFDQAVDPNGTPWKPLSPATIRQKRGRGRPLYRTGALRASIQTKAEGPLSSSIGTPIRYAFDHQYGTHAIPARPFLGVSRRAVDEVTNIMTRRLQELSYGMATVRVLDRDD